MIDASKSTTTPRLMSLDAFRGFIMVAMASRGIGFPKMAEKFPDSPTWTFLGYQFEHVAWVGCALWDLIQPAFMFMVGVAMAYSYASRQAKGHSYRRMLGHAVFRAAMLVLLSVFIYSDGQQQTLFTFKNVLSQIGLGYVFLFLLWNRPRRVQAAAAGAILVGYWAFFALYPTPPASFDYEQVSTYDWKPLEGFEAHWNKGTNAAAAFDRWLLNLFPREEQFEYDWGGYQTLNFIPALATMIFGLMTGELLRSGRSGRDKALRLVGWGLAGIAAATLIEALGICPIVKRIWTPTFGLYSTGWALLMLASFYMVVDLGNRHRWCWPLVVVGMNPLAMYLMDYLWRPWVEQSLDAHLGPPVFNFLFGEDYAPIVQQSMVLFIFWLACLWMYRQRIFVRI